MSTTPWNSIAEGVVQFEDRHLSLADARKSPCETCPTTPCCTHLPLQTFNITKLVDLDHAAYLLNFDRIVLGLSPSGQWSAYYRYPCRFLDREKLNCRVHATPAQPQICVHYNPYYCWYKNALTQSVSTEFLPIDRQRLEFISSQLEFDELRNIVALPTWDTMIAAFSAMSPPAAVPAPEPVTEDEATRAWKELLARPDTESAAPERVFRYDSLQDPCTGCSAYCCNALIFQHDVPASTGALDYYRFCLGFPGVELGIADGAWALIVRARCRHLQDNRCAIYGQPERPLVCKYYDALRCTYRVEFGVPRPGGFIRLRLEQFDWLADSFRFDQHGAALEIPPADAIRRHVEECWGEVLQTAASE